MILEIFGFRNNKRQLYKTITSETFITSAAQNINVTSFHLSRQRLEVLAPEVQTKTHLQVNDNLKCQHFNFFLLPFFFFFTWIKCFYTCCIHTYREGNIIFLIVVKYLYFYFYFFTFLWNKRKLKGCVLKLNAQCGWDKTRDADRLNFTSWSKLSKQLN